MFFEGKALMLPNYQVGYAMGNSPFGPFTEGANRPILFTRADSTIYCPGHYTVFREKGTGLYFYHRIHPQKEQFVLYSFVLMA